MECTELHPLNLPEIVASLAPFLSRSSLVTCFRASKLWYGVLVPCLWKETKFAPQSRLRSPTFSSIQKYASFIQSLSIDYNPALMLFQSASTFPILASLVIEKTVWHKPFDDPTLVDFIQRHRETLKSVTINQHASDAILEALEDCPRLESLTLENQKHVFDSTEWIRRFEQLWSHLHSMSLQNDDRLGLPKLEAATAMDWPRSNGPSRIQDLRLSLNRPEDILKFSSWIVKQFRISFV